MARSTSSTERAVAASAKPSFLYALIRGEHAVDGMWREGHPELSAGSPVTLPRALHAGVRVMPGDRRQRRRIPADIECQRSGR